MKIGYHGGKCCGIKTIFNMGYKPESLVPKQAEIKYNDALHGLDARGRLVNSAMDMYWGPELPEQSGKDRLIAYLEFLKVKRPSGLVEIALAETISDYTNQAPWFPVLEELGFKCTARWKNSNSSNWCSTWHLVMFDGAVTDNLGVTAKNEIIDQGDPDLELDPEDEPEDYEPDNESEDVTDEDAIAAVLDPRNASAGARVAALGTIPRPVAPRPPRSDGDPICGCGDPNCTIGL